MHKGQGAMEILILIDVQQGDAHTLHRKILIQVAHRLAHYHQTALKVEKS